MNAEVLIDVPVDDDGACGDCRRCRTSSVDVRRTAGRRAAAAAAGATLVARRRHPVLHASARPTWPR